MGDKFITIYTNLNLAPVEMLKSILEDNDINSLIKGYDSMRPYLSYATGIELVISQDDQAKAQALIKEMNFD